MRLLLIAVTHCMLKKPKFELDFGFFYIEQKWFRFLSSRSRINDESPSDIIYIKSAACSELDTPTLEEAMLYQKNWQDLVNTNKVLIGPVPEGNYYTLEDKLNVKFTMVTMSLPPISISPIIKKVTE